MDKPKYSFVLPAFKAEFLADSIQSILGQTYANFELVIVNDASPAPILPTVKEFHDERIAYYENEYNIGGKDLVENWNQCIAKATADYIILASDDDKYDSHFLEEIDKLTNQYPDVNVFRSRIDKINENNEVVDIDLSYPEHMSQLQYLHFWSRESMHHCIANFVYKAKALRDSQFVHFPAAWYSDDATAMLLANNGIVNTQSILTHFRISSNTVSSCSNKSVLKQKFLASNMFYEWVCELVRSIDADEKNVEQLKRIITYNAQKYINRIVRYDTLSLSKRNFIFCLNQLKANKTMYGKQKTLLFLEYLFK